MKRKSEEPTVSATSGSQGQRASRKDVGCKYYVSASVKGEILTPFIDTAADLSLIPPAWRERGKCTELTRPIKIRSFDGKSAQMLKEKVDLTLEFGTVRTSMTFYTCDVLTPIIGNDLLRDTRRRLSINTRTENLYIKGVAVRTAPNEIKSVALMRIRMKETPGKGVKTRESATNWARVKQKVVLRPHEVSSVEIHCDKLLSGGDDHVFLSLHDSDNDGPFFIPSVKMDGGPMTVWVENKTQERRVMEKGAPLGEMKRCGNHLDESTVMSFSTTEVSTAMTEEATFCAEATTEPSSGKAPGEERPPAKPPDASDAPGNKPVKLSTLAGAGRVSSEKIEECLKNGIEVDLELSTTEPRMEIDETPVDVEAEAQKSKTCEFWPDKEEFLKNFDLSNVDDQTADKTRELLLKFQHVFFNPKFPKQFQKGIKAPPIKMTLKPDAPPLVSERLRRMNETKLAYLKKHIEEFKAQGVIEELKDSTGCHLSPVHIVIEQRYVASEHRNVTKSRMVLDNRKVNECLTDVAFPIPFCDEFRRSVAAEGYTVFSNMDAASFYYQFHVDYETARKWFCFAALGRVYCLRRLCQGARNSPPIAQSFVTAAFREHSNSHPFMDDITVKSKTMDEHLEVDLPTSLAICSKFNILLKPSKCDLLRPEVRILGFQISRSAEALADEKKEKIMSMAFPTTKKEAVSKAAF